MVSSVLLLAVGQQFAYSGDFSGMPTLENGTGAVTIRSHSATIQLDGRDTAKGPLGTVRVSSVTVYRAGSQGFSGEIVIPRIRLGDRDSGATAFPIRVLLSERPIELRPRRTSSNVREFENNVVGYINSLVSPVKFAPNTTYSVRMTYAVPIGRAGFEQKRRTLFYAMFEDRPVEDIRVSIQYNQGTVFNLPEINSNLRFQIGTSGAYASARNWTPVNELLQMLFYSPDL